MPRIIKSYNFWHAQRLQPIPENVDELVGGLTVKQQSDFRLAIEIVRLLHRDDGSRRTIHGVNQVAQKRFPGRGIWIGLTESIVYCWRMTGWISLMGAVLKPKVELLKGQFCYEHPHHVLQSLAVVAVEKFVDGEEVIQITAPSAEFYTSENPDNRFRVAAETDQGKYKFGVMFARVPEWGELQRYCCWHTRLVE